MNIINRIGRYRNGSWGQRSLSDITKITVHHTAIQQGQSDDELLRALQNHHENGNGWPGLAYHFVITPNGNAYQTNNFSDITWHDTVNTDSIGIVVHGYFHPTFNEVPTGEQLKSLRQLLDELCSKHPEFPAEQKDVYAHKDRTQTACPGNNMYNLIKEYRERLGNVSWGNYIVEAEALTNSSISNWAKLTAYLGLSPLASYEAVTGKFDYTSNRLKIVERSLKECQDNIVPDEKLSAVINAEVKDKIKAMSIFDFIRSKLGN